MPKLYVAMYRPEEGNYEHWALYLDMKDKIYQVTGASPNFERNITTGKPASDIRHVRSIFVYDINDGDFAEFEETVAAVEPDNSVSHWNCQDYVIELLDNLEEECVIQGDDEEYVAAKEQVLSHYKGL